jgi:hypothetical protein
MLEIAGSLNLLTGKHNIKNYLAIMQQRKAYQKAVSHG